MKTGSPAEALAAGQEAPALRRFPRYPFQLPFLYRVHPVLVSAPPPVGLGWTRTLSEEEAAVDLTESLAPGTPLTVLFQTPRGPLELHAEVAWSGGPLPDGGGLLHGLAFNQPNSKVLHALRNLFQTLNVFRELSVPPRASLRLPAVIPATCQAKYPPGPRLQGRTGNISREGLLLLLPEVLAPGTVLAVTLESPHEPVSLEGVVVWRDASARAALENWVRHGVQLTSRDWATAVALGHLVAGLGEAPGPLQEPGGRARTGAVE